MDKLTPNEPQRQLQKDFGPTQVKSIAELTPNHRYLYHWESRAQPGLSGITTFEFLHVDYLTKVTHIGHSTHYSYSICPT